MTLSSTVKEGEVKEVEEALVEEVEEGTISTLKGENKLTRRKPSSVITARRRVIKKLNVGRNKRSRALVVIRKLSPR